MTISTLEVTMSYYTPAEEDARLIIDGIISALRAGRASAQLLIMTGDKRRPPPSLTVTLDFGTGPEEIDVDTWAQERGLEDTDA